MVALKSFCDIPLISVLSPQEIQGMNINLSFADSSTTALSHRSEKTEEQG